MQVIDFEDIKKINTASYVIHKRVCTRGYHRLIKT